MPKLKNNHKFNLFIFFTMFAKFSVELFMPVILYKLNYSINQILLFLLLTFIINIAVSIPATNMGRRWGYKYLILISTFLFIALYFLVSLMSKNILFFLAVAVLSSLTNIFYYLGRHFYAGVVLEDKQMARKVGSILIATVLASMAGSVFSSIFLERLSMFSLAIIVTIIYLIGIIFIFFLPNPSKNIPIKLKEVNKKVDNYNKLFFLLEQFKVTFFTLYPLYVYIYVDNTYTFLGLVYLVTGLASIIFIYLFSQKIEDNKHNYLKISTTLLASILFLDMIIKSKYLVLIIVFIEGIIIKLYETSVTNIMYALKGDLEGSCYFLYMEILYNIGRIIIVLFMLIFHLKMRTVLYLCIIFIFISGFIKVRIPNKKSS